MTFITRKKNGFVSAAKLGKANIVLVAATQNFAAATKRFVDRTKHFVVVTKYFFIPILTNDFVDITKPFPPCSRAHMLCFKMKLTLINSNPEF